MRLTNNKSKLIDLLIADTRLCDIRRIFNISGSCLKGRIDQLRRDLHLPISFSKRHYPKYKKEVYEAVKLASEQSDIHTAYLQKCDNLFEDFEY